MISRNKAKIEDKLRAIKEIYPSRDCFSVVCDFSKQTTIAQYRELVKSSGVDKIDIGIICLNAGVFNIGALDLIEDERYEQVWNVNGLHVVYLMKALVD